MSEINKHKRKGTPDMNIGQTEQYRQFAGYGLMIAIVLISMFGIFGAIAGNNQPEDADDTLIPSLAVMADLTTVEVKAAKIGVFSELRRGICKFGAEYLINGTIEAGIDLANFSEANVSLEDDVYMISLPEPELTRCEFNVQRYGDYSSICAGVDYSELDSIARYKSQGELIDDVLSGGILKRSERETTLLFQNLIKTLTGKSVRIEFATPDIAPNMPDSCELTPPRGYILNDDGVWIRQ